MEPLTHGLLQEAGSSPSTGRFRPYASTIHRVTRGRYITSNDRRGYIPVYEYPLNGQWIMMDVDDGYILWTGIWKALGNAKADIVKMLESQPDLAPQLRRVRGGYLKIQGTWMPYEVALRLARRVAWPIREDLIPLFGPTFPSTCLTPDQPGYGQILGTQQGRRRGRRAAVPLPLSATLPPPQPSEFDSSPGGQQTRQPGPSSLPPLSAVTIRERPTRLFSPSQIAGPSGTRHDDYFDDGRYAGGSSGVLRPTFTIVPSQIQGHPRHGYGPSSMAPPPPPRQYSRPGSADSQNRSPSSGPVRDPATLSTTVGTRDRFSPYQHTAHPRQRSSNVKDSAFARPSPVDLPPLTIPSSRPRMASSIDFGTRSADTALMGLGTSSMGMSTPIHGSGLTTATLPTASSELIDLPPIRMRSPALGTIDESRRRSSSFYSSGSGSGYSLPPISALSNLPPPPASGTSHYHLDSNAVLKRLALDDEVLGESRRTSFVAVSDAEGSHRDGEDDTGRTIESPTQEQLWRRRRSLSEPPSQQETIPNPQPAWSASSNMSLIRSAGPSPTRFHLSSILTSTGYPGFGREIGGSNVRSPSGTSSPFGQRDQMQPIVYARAGLEGGYQTDDRMFVESPSLSHINEQSHEGYEEESANQPGRLSAMDDGKQTPRQFTDSIETEHWRPQARSRAHTSSGYQAYGHATPTSMRLPSQTTAELSSYRFGAESHSTREEARSLPSSVDRSTRNV